MSASMSSVRLERLNRLMLELGREKRISRSELFTRLGYISPRTLERDIAYLRRSFGVQITYDFHEKLYRIDGSGSFLVNLQLSDSEVIALAAGLSMTSHFLPHLRSAGKQLWGKLRISISDKLADKGEELSRSVVVGMPVSSMDETVFQNLCKAIDEQTALNVHYVSPKKESEFVLSPWGVFFRAHGWYLWAYVHRHKSAGTFKLSRIQALEEAHDEYVAPPEGEKITDYASSAWFAVAGKERYAVRILIRQPLAYSICETCWHPSQELEQQPDGSVILSALVPSLEEVARWVLASAPHAQVLAPDRLKELVQTWAKSFLEQE